MSVGVRLVSCLCVAVSVGKGLITSLGLMSASPSPPPGLPSLGPQLKGTTGLQTPSKSCAAGAEQENPPLWPEAGSQPADFTPRTPLDSPPRFQSPCSPQQPPRGPPPPSLSALEPRGGLALCLLLLHPPCRQHRAPSTSPKTKSKGGGFPWSAVGEGGGAAFQRPGPAPPPWLLLRLPPRCRLSPGPKFSVCPSGPRAPCSLLGPPEGSPLGLPGAWKIQLTSPSLDGPAAVPAEPSRAVHP